MKTALITGATSGIGMATAKLFTAKGYKLILCGRRTERLNELKNELNTEVHTLTFDVRNREDVFKALESIHNEFQDIDILLNNAGNAHGLSSIQNGNLDDWDAMMDGNVKGLLYVTKAILPNMIARNSGFIVNIGSVAAKEVYPNGNVYCASKHAVDALSKSMRVDLAGHNIRVAAIHPGAVETEFSEVRFKGDTEKADNVYKGFDALQAQDIAEIIEFITSRPSHVNIEDLVVYPTAQANTTTLTRK
jgi:3-hydroxy acid dehydrogenase/malonic semialdehyde reductase